MLTATTTNDATKVSTGKPMKAGAIYRAPLGTTLPTTANATLDSAFAALGYISEDGVTNNNSQETDSIKAWGGDIVAYFQNGKEDTFGFTLIEALNANVLKTVYGDANVEVDGTTGNITVQANSTELGENSYVIDMIMLSGALKRIVIPTAKVTEIGEITYKDDDAIGYEVTLACTPDSDGNTHYEYIKFPTVSASTTTTTP